MTNTGQTDGVKSITANTFIDIYKEIHDNLIDLLNREIESNKGSGLYCSVALSNEHYPDFQNRDLDFDDYLVKKLGAEYRNWMFSYHRMSYGILVISINSMLYSG